MGRLAFATMTCGALVAAGIMTAAGGCGSFDAGTSGDSDAGDEGTSADATTESAPTGSADASAGDGDAASHLTAVYSTSFGSADDAGDAGAEIFPTGMFVEPSGGVALVGTYDYGAVDVGGLPLSLPSAADAFLMRLDANGAPLLAKAFNDAQDQYGATLAGTNDKLYASFEVSSTMSFTASDIMNSNGIGGKFNSTTVRLDRSGTSSGLAHFHGPSTVLVKGTALGAGDSVISFGDWDDSLSVDGMSSVTRTPSKTGLFFMRSFLLTGADIIKTGYCDDGTTCIASAFASNPQTGESLGGGRFGGKISAADGGITTAPNDNDAYVMKLDVNLEQLWVKALRGSGTEEILAATSILGTDFIVAGSFDGTLEIPGKPTSSTKGSADVFVARLDKNGSVVWVKTFGGTGTDLARAVTADSTGNIFLTGRFSGPTIEVDGTTLTNADKVTGLGTNDVFVIWLDSDGHARSSSRFGGGGDDDVDAIGVDGSGNVVIAGSFDRTIDFGKGVLTARGRVDLFVAKFAR